MKIPPRTTVQRSSFAGELIPASSVWARETSARLNRTPNLRRGRIRFRVRRRRRTLKLRKYLAQSPNQLIPRNMTLLKLNPELERLIFRLKLKNKRLRPLRTGLLFPAFPPRLVARQPALQDAMQHLHHFLFGGLPRNLQQRRLRHDTLLDTLLAH